MEDERGVGGRLCQPPCSQQGLINSGGIRQQVSGLPREVGEGWVVLVVPKAGGNHRQVHITGSSGVPATGVCKEGAVQHVGQHLALRKVLERGGGLGGCPLQDGLIAQSCL